MLQKQLLLCWRHGSYKGLGCHLQVVFHCDRHKNIEGKDRPTRLYSSWRPGKTGAADVLVLLKPCFWDYLHHSPSFLVWFVAQELCCRRFLSNSVAATSLRSHLLSSLTPLPATKKCVMFCICSAQGVTVLGVVLLSGYGL